jgi:holo-[acyl-carrier protein] synthase
MSNESRISAAGMAGAVPSVLGIGHDVVDLEDMAAQLADAGSRFGELFSVRERRQAKRKAAAHGDSAARHLAACWAGKECVVKAWTEALGERAFPLSLDGFEWAKIEILSNSKGCPSVTLAADYARVLAVSLDYESSDALAWKISLSHSKELASGVALLCACGIEPAESI